MARKSRVKEGAFDWVDGATKKDEQQDTKKRTPSSQKSATKKISPKRTAKKTRVISITYKKETGEILAIQESQQSGAIDDKFILSQLPEEMDFKSIKLTNQFAGKRLIEIHKNCKIIKSGRGVKLALKQG